MITVTDLFCGAGGSSTGAIQVPGVEVRAASNHWQLAVDTHQTNHPDADHICADLYQVAARIGISYRSLDRWVRRGYVPGRAPGSGYPRRWTPEAITAAARVAGLVRAGFTVAAAAGLVRAGISDDAIAAIRAHVTVTTTTPTNGSPTP